MSRLLLLLGLLLFALPASAQTPGVCELGQATAELSLSDVRAPVYNKGTLFWPLAPGYEVPRGSGNRPIQDIFLILGGRVAGEVRTAEAQYGAAEFWPGPLDDGATLPDPADCSAFDRIFHVTLPDLLTYEETGVPTPGLTAWPVGLGAPAVDASGAPIVPTSREQVLDLEAGERPVIYGTETLFWVENDVGNVHALGGSAPLGVEVRTTAFSIYNPAVAALNQATIYRYEVINRSDAVIDDFHLGFHVDHSIGGFQDDHVGSDVARQMWYAYNADDFDQFYGTAPPAFGVDFLSGGYSTLRIINNGSAVGYPQTAAESYNYLTGRWRDGTPLTRGFIGYNPDSTDTVRWAYDADPVSGAYWSEVNTDGDGRRNPPGGQHGRVSTPPVTLAPGASRTADIALVFARGADHLDSITELRAASDLVQARYDDGSLFGPGGIPEVLATPQPVSPAEGELVSGPAFIPLEWSAVPGAETYVVQRAARADFSSYVTTVTTDLSVQFRADIADEPVPVYWRVRAEGDGATSPYSDVRTFSYLNLTPDFLGQGRGIVEVARPDGAVCPDGSDDYGCTRDLGNTVFLDPDASGDYFVTGAIQNAIQLVRRHVGAAAPGTFEIRFTDTGGLALEGTLNASDEFDTEADHEVLRVPFELWALGTTPDDPDDDLRMIPVIGNPGEGRTDWTDAFPSSTPNPTPGLPATAPLNGVMPDRRGGYALFHAAALASGGPGAVYVDTDDEVTPIDPGTYLIGDHDPFRDEACAATGYYISFCYRNDQTSRVLGSAWPGSRFVAPISGLVFADLVGDGTTPPTGTVIRFNTTPVGSYVVGAEEETEATATELFPVRPNPSRGTAEVTLRLETAGPALARVVDVLGREVAVIAEGVLPAGDHRFDLPARLAPGVYVVAVEADGRRFVRTFTVVR